MTTISMRDLSRQTAHVLDEVERTQRPALVTRNGRPVAALVPIDGEDLEDYLLANAEEYVAAMREADEDMAAGRGRAAADVFAELLKDTR